MSTALAHPEPETTTPPVEPVNLLELPPHRTGCAPSRRKRWLARMLSGTGGLGLVRRWNRASGPTIPVLAYHRGFDPGPIDRFPYDVELVSATPRQFEWQMGFLKQHYNPIRFADLLAYFEGEFKLPPRPVIVTFDDGYADNHTHAWPILRQLEIPATVFLATGYVGSPVTFWYDRLACSLLETSRKTLTLDGLGEHPVSDHPAERRVLLGRLLRLMKQVSNSMRLAWLCQIEEQLSDVPLRERDSRSKPLTWSQVREMSETGIEFGSHTVSHPILSQCSAEELEFELAESYSALARHLERFVPVLSYPVGGPTAFNTRVVDEARQCGYRLAASYIHGTNVMSRLDRYALRRIHIERYHDADHFAAMLELPEWF